MPATEPMPLMMTSSPNSSARRARALRRVQTGAVHRCDALRREVAQRHQAGSAPDWITVERSSVKHGTRPSGVENLHDLPRPAEGAEGRAAAEEFAEHDQVRLQREFLGGTANRQSQHQTIIEDGQCAVAARQSLQIAEKPGCGRHHATGDQYGFDHDGGDLLAVLRHHALVAARYC